jgi:hypothetical protein
MGVAQVVCAETWRDGEPRADAANEIQRTASVFFAEAELDRKLK